MNEKQQQLELMKKSPYLTVNEAMNLIIGEVPGTYKFDLANEKDMPSNAVPIYRALIHDISKFKLSIYFAEMWIEKGAHAFLPEPRPATEDTIMQFVGFEEYYQSGCWWYRGKLSTNELTKWLKDTGIASPLFGTHMINIPDYLNNELEEHSYKLAAAIKAWEHFYNNPDQIKSGKSLKDNIIKWLTDNAESLNLIYKGNTNITAIEEIAKVVNWDTKGGAPSQ